MAHVSTPASLTCAPGLMATALFRHRATGKLHRGFLRQRGAKTYCGIRLLAQRDGLYGARGRGSAFERLSITGGPPGSAKVSVAELDRMSRTASCRRCFG